MITKEEISMLNTNNFLEGVSIIEKYWNQDYGTFDIEGKDGIITLVLTTGGWSENEAIIDILTNKAFWFLWWQESKRGGYYKFIYTEKMAKEEDSILSKGEIEKAKKVLYSLSIGDFNLRVFEVKMVTKTILKYIEQLEKSDASKEQSSMNYYNQNIVLKQKLDEAWEEWNNLDEYCNQELQKKNRKIKQLELDKQKLIEKLEERKKQNDNKYGQAIDNNKLPEMYEMYEIYEIHGRMKEDNYILSILKG